eukprot:2375840-Pleurochrysis_carterae.AAC.1
MPKCAAMTWTYCHRAEEWNWDVTRQQRCCCKADIYHGNTATQPVNLHLSALQSLGDNSPQMAGPISSQLGV